MISTLPTAPSIRAMRRLTSIFSCAALVALLSTSACVSYQFTDEEVHIRHDAKADTLDLLVVQRGIGAKDGANDDEWRKVVDLFVDFAKPDRRVVCCGPTPESLLSGSFDEPSDSDRQSPWYPAAERLSIPSEGFFRDERGRLSLWQHLHLREASVALAAIDEAISQGVLRDLDEEDRQREKTGVAAPPTKDGLDDTTRALRRVFAATHQKWLEWRDGALFVELPVSDVGKRNAIRALLGEVATPTSSDATQPDNVRRGLLDMHADWMALVDSISYEHHKLVFRLGHDDRIDFTTHVDGLGYDAKVVELVRKRGIAIDEKATRDSIVARFETVLASNASVRSPSNDPDSPKQR